MVMGGEASKMWQSRPVKSSFSGQQVEGDLGALIVIHEPIGSSGNGGSTHISANDHVSEEQPSGDEGLLGGTGFAAHDVEIGGVEAQGGGGETISNQVDPQELDGDQSLGQTQGSGKEDTDDLANVGGDEVSDELFHVVVDGSALLNSRHDGREVVVSQDHLRGRLGNGSARAHG